MHRTFTQADHAELVANPDAQVYRKRSRIVAVRMSESFTVRTDRGPMEGSAGDWLVTNHPADDPGSDLWTISDERMMATYEITDDHVFPGGERVIEAKVREIEGGG